jgi:hypothetical protein
MRTLLRNLILSFLSILLVLFVLEGVFRLARREDALKLSMGRVDAKYHHTFEPNSVLHLVSQHPGEFDVRATINNFGFRGPQMSLEKPKGARRIFIVGDSFTFGVGAKDDETIPARLQQTADPSAQKIELINVGRGSTCPLIYYLRLREEIPKFRPDGVVMLLDFSDLWEDWNFEKNILYDRKGEMIGLNPYYEYGRFQWWNFLRANSVFASYLHNKVVRTVLQIQKLGLRRYLQAIAQGKKAKAVIATVETDTIAHDGRLFLRGSQKKEEIERHFERTARYILMCRDLARQYGAGFALALYPYGIQVGPDQWSEGRVSWGFEKGKTYTDTFSFDLVESFARKNGIPFINLLEPVRAHAGEKLYFPYDGHFTPAANRVVATALMQSPVFREVLDGGADPSRDQAVARTTPQPRRMNDGNAQGH